MARVRTCSIGVFSVHQVHPDMVLYAAVVALLQQ